jgi:membrane-bound ClpP family serine protease
MRLLHIFFNLVIIAIIVELFSKGQYGEAIGLIVLLLVFVVFTIGPVWIWPMRKK